MLDQLDQAFERNSLIEKQALHALISELTSFNSERIKLKIFLREDIFELISEYRGIVNSDHLRTSDVLRWEEVELIRMILKRILRVPTIRAHFKSIVGDELAGVDAIELEAGLNVFYSLFPELGKKGAPMWDYIMRELSDGTGEVTPRDLIGFTEEAKEAQIKLIDAGEKEITLFSKQAVERALDKTSAKKLQRYINAEFPYLSSQIAKLKMGRNKYEPGDLEALFGDDQTTIKALVSVGLLHRKQGGNYYWIAPVLVSAKCFITWRKN